MFYFLKIYVVYVIILKRKFNTVEKKIQYGWQKVITKKVTFFKVKHLLQNLLNPIFLTIHQFFSSIIYIFY